MLLLPDLTVVGGHLPVVGGCLFVPDCPDHEIITQKLYYLNHCLDNHLSVLLASSYTFGQPISIILYFTMRLVTYQQSSSQQLVSSPLAAL